MNNRESIPTCAGIYQAIRSFDYRLEDSRLSDLIGNAGVNLVFSEFAPIAGDLQRIITLGHQIDHINDEGLMYCNFPLREWNSSTLK